MIDQLIINARVEEKSETNENSTSENSLRSLAKTISWRVIGTMDTVLISWLITGTLTLALSIGSSIHRWYSGF